MLDFARSGNVRLFFRKLVRLERDGVEVGQSLGRDLATWRKIVVGDRTWRILFRGNADGTVATIWVIGDREDMACYHIAVRRLEASGSTAPQVLSLAEAMLRVDEFMRPKRRR